MADSVGNRLGKRRTMVYESDTGVSYNVSLDESVALAVGNDPSTNGSFPVLRASQSFPLKPRYVLMSLNSDPSVTKKAVIGDIENALFQSSAPTQVTINGVVYTVTTRVGERRSVLRVGEPPA